MYSFVKFFSVSSVKELEDEINNYIGDRSIEVTAISMVPSLYHGYFEAIVAFRRI